MTRSKRYPSHLVFDHEPDADELKHIVGPDFAGSYVDYREDDEYLRVAPQSIPLRVLCALLIIFCSIMTAAPFVLPEFGVNLPAHITDGMLVGFALLTWLIILPAMIGLFYCMHRVAKKVGPGAIVTKRTGELQLPWLGRVVEKQRIERFVALFGRHRYAGNVATVGQFCVLFKDDQDGYVYAPFARLTTRRSGQTAAQKLADFYDVRLQRIEAGLL